MTRHFSMHSQNPQPRLLRQAAEALGKGQLIAYPTDSTYALGCALNSRQALQAIRQIRGLSENHPLSLICDSIAQAAQYAIIDDDNYRILKATTPGAYTFILPATKNVPRHGMGIKRRLVGIRIPNYPIATGIVEALGEPIMSSSLWLKGDDAPLEETKEIAKLTQSKVSLVLEVGKICHKATTVVDLTQTPPEVIRQGDEIFPA